jgi:hypothetical protein
MAGCPQYGALGEIFGDILRSGAFLLKIERLNPVARGAPPELEADRGARGGL